MEKAIYQIKNLNHTIMRYCYITGALKDNLPTPAQMQILHYIGSKKGKKVYQRDIAVSLGLRRATLSEILKTMERNKLISKVSDEKDTRIKEIILSENAKEKFEAVKKTLDATEKAAIRGINQKELEIFFKVVKKMQENLNKEGIDIC